MADNVWIGVDYRSPKYDRIEDADPLESYQGKWAICYVLDNGTCVYSNPKKWKDSENEKIQDIEKQEIQTEKLNKEGGCMRRNNWSGVKYECLFNNGHQKGKLKMLGYPVCISMFPIPVK